MNDKNNDKESEESTVMDVYYKKITRVVEYYVIACFIIITIFPLFEYGWVPGFIKFIYFTGFPLLILLILVSLVKDPLLNFLEKFVSNTGEADQSRAK